MARVYVAGPYTQGDTVLNVREAIRAADKLAEMGFWPYIPHLNHLWQFVSPKSYEFWLTLDIQYLDVCDLLFRVPGYSPGAEREVARAKERNIPVIHTLEEAKLWLSKAGN